MSTKAKNIRMISLGLIGVYGIIFLQQFLSFSQDGLNNLLILSFVAFTALIISLFSASQTIEWGRRSTVALIILISLYFVILFMKYPLTVHFTYILLNIVVVLYYCQKGTKIHFIADFSAVRKSVLVIDDDESLQKTIQRILLARGYSVLTATTGEKGLQVAQVQKPDLILLDVILPGIKGREVCQILKEDGLTKDIPVIFLTAKDSPDDINAERAAGAVSHLTKPVDSKVLVAEIKKVLG